MSLRSDRMACAGVSFELCYVLRRSAFSFCSWCAAVELSDILTPGMLRAIQQSQDAIHMHFPWTAVVLPRRHENHDGDRHHDCDPDGSGATAQTVHLTKPPTFDGPGR